MVSIIASKLKVKDGETVELTCTVPDFFDNIVILQDVNTRAVQIKGREFVAQSVYYTVTKSGSAEIIFRILQFSKSRDEGSWAIRYGVEDENTSTPVTLSAFIEITASIDNVKDGQSVVLSCTVPDFERSILIKQDGIRRGGCSFSSCSTDIEDYTIKIEGTTVILTINSFSKTRDVGSWSVNYGGYNESTPITLSACTDRDDHKEDGLWTKIALVPVVGSIAAAAGIIYVAKKYCTSKNKETIHVEKGTHVTLGHKIPNAGKAVWEKNDETFEDYHVEVNGTMIHFHEALPTDSGSYVCTYGDNSETLKYDLIVEELEKKDSADSFRPHHNSLPPLKVTTEQE